MSERFKKNSEKDFYAIKNLLADGKYDKVDRICSKSQNNYKNSDDFWLMWAQAKYYKRDYNTSLNLYMKVLEINPQSRHGKNGLGCLLKILGEYKIAESMFLEVINENTDFYEAYNNLANLYRDLGRYADAEELYKHSIDQGNNTDAAWNNLGLLYKDLQILDNAIICFENALAISDKNQDICFNYAISLLKSGRFEEGWQWYEKRWGLANLERKQSEFNKKFSKWEGQTLEGKSIVFWCEQGLGDAIQMFRFLKDIKSSINNVKILLCIDKSLHRLFDHQQVSDFISADIKNIKVADYHCSFMSLPKIFFHPEKEFERKKYLSAQPSWSEPFVQKLSTFHGKKLVGIAWKTGVSGIGHAALEQTTRSMTDEAVLQLIRSAPSNIIFVNLQPHSKFPDEENLPNIVNLTTLINDFADTAGLIACLDVVVTVDTSVAHLAGALNVPVMVMMSYQGGNLFPASGSKMAWYACMELIWQESPGQWESTIANVNTKLLSLT